MSATVIAIRPARIIAAAERTKKQQRRDRIKHHNARVLADCELV